ncbi:MAG: glycosyl hydrolase [Gemmatimonadota bacterium]|nr:glycosyl hydrolase [Gemmatimonadota bacterium]
MALPIIVASLCVACAAAAQTPSAVAFDSTHFTGLRWRSIGPNRGGRSTAAAGSASRPYEYYFGAVGGGLWKTTDGGLTWQPVTDGKIRSSSVGAVAVSESNPDVVYIGMGETELRGNIMQGDGVYKSTDAGKSWKHMGLAETQAVARIRVDRTNADLVFVAALGHPYAPNAERGVFRSKDGGAKWEKVLFRNDRTGAVDLSIDPRNGQTLFAALWDVGRTPWSLTSGGAGSGLFKSTDGGDHWTEVTRNPGMPAGIIGKIGVSVSGADGNRVYAIVEADSGGVFRSDDAGTSWKRTNDGRKIRQRAFYYSRIYADPAVKDRVYALNTSMYRSDDGGVKFDTTVRDPHGDNHDLWIAPNDSRRLINSNDGGGNVSVNAGQTWTTQRYPTAQAYRVATTRDFPYHVCGAQQDNSTFCVPSSDWQNWGGLMGGGRGAPGDWFYHVGGGESGYIAPDPVNPDIFYAGSQGALLTRYDRSNGQIRDVEVYPRFFSGEPASALPERWQWTFPIVFSPVDPHVIYASSQHLFRSVNKGQSWSRISPDLTRADPATLGESGGPITHDMNGPEIYGTIFTIAPSKKDALTIWTGSDDGLVQITRDGGKSWANVTPPDLPKFARVSLIDASSHHAGTAYVAAKRYQMDDRAPYIYATSDFGKSWRKIVTGIRADDYVHAVREDPKRAGLLYAGTEHGVYVSFDDGGRWQSLSLNLPDVQVPDLVVEEKDLVIATHGRSMYVLDDIGPIRQLTAEIAAEPLHLFTPHDAVRGVYPATIHYYLSRPADSVTIQILDARGTIIRTFVGTKKDRPAPKDSTAARAKAGAADSGRAAVVIGDSIGRVRARRDSLSRDSSARDSADEFRRPVPKAPTTAGLNRFEWDLSYPGSVVFPKMILWGADADGGPTAIPGHYQVRVTADGRSQIRSFGIRIDPRLKGVTQADLLAQFALAVRIRDRTSDANEAVIRIRDLEKQIANRVAGASDAAVLSAAATARSRLVEREDALYQTRNRSGQDPLNFPIRLNNRLASLRSKLEFGDGRPTAGSYVVFRELSAALDRELAALDRVIREDVGALNRVLVGAKLGPVEPSAASRRTSGPATP